MFPPIKKNPSTGSSATVRRGEAGSGRRHLNEDGVHSGRQLTTYKQQPQQFLYQDSLSKELRYRMKIKETKDQIQIIESRQQQLEKLYLNSEKNFQSLQTQLNTCHKLFGKVKHRKAKGSPRKIAQMIKIYFFLAIITDYYPQQSYNSLQ